MLQGDVAPSNKARYLYAVTEDSLRGCAEPFRVVAAKWLPRHPRSWVYGTLAAIRTITWMVYLLRFLVPSGSLHHPLVL